LAAWGRAGRGGRSGFLLLVPEGGRSGRAGGEDWGGRPPEERIGEVGDARPRRSRPLLRPRGCGAEPLRPASAVWRSCAREAAPTSAREAAGRSRSGLRPPCGGPAPARPLPPAPARLRGGAASACVHRGRAGRDGGRGWRPGKEGTGGVVEEDERKKERSKRYVCN